MERAQFQRTNADLYGMFVANTVLFPASELDLNRKSVDADPSVIQAAKEGDSIAFDHIYGIYQKRLLHFCQARVPVDYAEDCTQDIWERLCRKFPDFIVTNGRSFSGYLFTTAYNLCIDFSRKEKKARGNVYISGTVQLTSTDSFTDPETVVDSQFTKETLARGVGELKDRQAELLIRRYRDGLPYSEIAGAVGKKEVAVRVDVWRGVQRLKEILPLDDLR